MTLSWDGVNEIKFNIPQVEELKPTWIENWYNGKYGYCVQLMTDDNMQVGDSFYGSKDGALMTEKEWEQQYNIDHKYSMKKRKQYRRYLKRK